MRVSCIMYSIDTYTCYETRQTQHEHMHFESLGSAVPVRWRFSAGGSHFLDSSVDTVRPNMKLSTPYTLKMIPFDRDDRCITDYPRAIGLSVECGRRCGLGILPIFSIGPIGDWGKPCS